MALAAITSLTLIEGGAPKPVQCCKNGDPAQLFHTNEITWDASSVVNITAATDGVTWNFSANPRGSSTSFGISAHYTPTNGDPAISNVLTLNVNLPGITSIGFLG